MIKCKKTCYFKIVTVIIVFTYIQTLKAQTGPLFLETISSKQTLTQKQQQYLSSYQKIPAFSAIKIVRLTKILPDANSVILNLISQNNIMVYQTKLEQRAEKDYSWFGEMKESMGNIILTVNNGNITGKILYANKEYDILPLGDGLHILTTIDYQHMPNDHPESFKKIEQQSNDKLNLLYKKLDKDTSQNKEYASLTCAPVIRVLVASTQAARASVADMNALIRAAVDDANQSYRNSGINLTMQLAGIVELNYTEVDIDTDLGRFRNDGDGFMDEIHRIRNERTADVCVLIDNETAVCGKAADILANVNTGFCVVGWSCAVDNHSFAHEVGHLQGARHNPEADGTTTPYAYGHGFQYRSTTNGGPWRTIMAYNDGCSCTRLQFWSNPNITQNTVPMGTAATHHNARVLNETANTLAAFRDENLALATANITDTRTYEARGFVNTTSDFIVGSGANVSFRAGQSITLSPGFNAKLNSRFQATIISGLDCDGKPIGTLLPISNQIEIKKENNKIIDPSIEALQVYPNPFNNKLTISYNTIENNDKISIEILSVTGNRVIVLQQSQKTTKGKHSIDWNATNVPSGIYIIVLTTNTSKKIQKVVKL